LTDDDIEHETTDSNVVTSSGPSEPLVLYDFMVVSIDSFSSESLKFLSMIQ